MKIATVKIGNKYEVYFKDRYNDGYKRSILFDYLKGEGGLIKVVGQKGFSDAIY